MWILKSAVVANYLLYLRAEVDDTSFTVIKFLTKLLHDVGPVARETL